MDDIFQKIITLHAGGWCMEDIAEELGVDVDEVWNTLWEAGEL